MISFLRKRNSERAGLFSWGMFGGRCALTHVLVDYSKYIYVYRNSHYLYFHFCVQYEAVFDRCVPKIVCRCVFSLCAIWSWDLVGQCLHSGGCVCVQMCILYVVSATEVHDREGGLQGHMKGLFNPSLSPLLEYKGVWWSERRSRKREKPCSHCRTFI